MTRSPGRGVLVVLRALGLGDLLTAVPALRALARAFPDHTKVLVCPETLAPLATVSGAVDAVAHADFRRDAPSAAGLPVLLARPDVAVNLHGRGPESHRALLALAPRRLIAHGNRHAGVAGPPWCAEQHEVDRWCALLEAYGIPAEATDLRLDVPPGVPAGVPRHPVLLHPGAASGSRRWPPARWAAVARAERVLGRDVVLTGGAGERDVALEVARRAGTGAQRVLAGRTSLWAMARLVASARVLVSGDTGPAHLATAVGTPSVVLFGPVPPSRWGPRVNRRRHVALWRGHHGDPHGERVDPGLLRISVAEVLAALRATRV